MHACPVRAASFLMLAILTVATCGQAPEPVPARDGRRLVYELPVDALQRTLQKEPKRDLEQVLDQMVRTVTARVGDDVRVRRHAASGFTVDVPPGLVPQVAALRRRIEASGKLEMRIVADNEFIEGPVKFNMQEEKNRLERWLKQEGNKKLLLEDPKNIRRFNETPPPEGPQQSGNLAWFARKLGQNPKNREHWDDTWTNPKFRALAPATVKGYDDAEWNNGVIPESFTKKPAADRYLIEFVAVNMKERCFTGEDLDAAGTSAGPGRDGSLAVHYSLAAGLEGAYADWSEKYIGKASAVVLNGIVQSAPVFQSRIPGRGEISGSFTRQEVDDLVIVLKSGSLPMAPKFVVEEPLPASDSGRARK